MTPCVHNVIESHQVGNYCAATLRIDFGKMEDAFDLSLLTALLETVPQLLSSIEEPNLSDRLLSLGRAYWPQDWRIYANNEMQRNWHDFVEHFLKTVPLLTEDEARSRLGIDKSAALPDLMKVTHRATTFYFADQFSEHGGVHKECSAVLRILKTAADTSDWDIAFWWIRPSGWLDGLSPRDLYKEDPDGLFDAAVQEVADD